MSRTTLNAVIDAGAYVGLVALATTGLMLRYQMPPGSGGLHGMGSGEGAGSRPVTVVWGLSRHEWGSVHYWIALLLMGVLAVHLILHWKWILCVLHGKPHTGASGSRFALGVAGLLLMSLLAAAPLLTPAQTTSRSDRLEDSAANDPSDLKGLDEDDEAGDGESIRGFMTLDEVSRVSRVPVSVILERLGLPSDTASSEQVGRLLRVHGMEMSKLRQAVREEQPER